MRSKGGSHVGSLELGDELAIEVLIEEARGRQWRRRMRVSLVLFAAATALFVELLVSAGSANPAPPADRHGAGGPNHLIATGTALPASCTAPYDPNPVGNLDAAPSGPAVFNWMDDTFTARYPTVWGGQAGRPVQDPTSPGDVVNVMYYRETGHDAQLEREVRAIDPAATFAIVQFSRACLMDLNDAVKKEVFNPPFSTWGVMSVGSGLHRVVGESSHCGAGEMRRATQWFSRRYGNQLLFKPCQPMAIAMNETSRIP